MPQAKPTRARAAVHAASLHSDLRRRQFALGPLTHGPHPSPPALLTPVTPNTQIHTGSLGGLELRGLGA